MRMRGAGRSKPMPDLRQEIFTLLKDIIDGEWGPYDDEHYWPMVDEFMAKAGITREQRTLADGMGGISTNYESGQVTVHSRPCTRQSRYITEWVPDA